MGKELVEPAAPKRRRRTRLTTPEPDAVSRAEFEDMKRELEVEEERPARQTSTLTRPTARRQPEQAQTRPKARPDGGGKAATPDATRAPAPEQTPARTPEAEETPAPDGGRTAAPDGGRTPDGAPAPAPDIPENEGVAPVPKRNPSKSKSRSRSRRHGRRR